METTEGTLVNLRRYLNRPNSAFDRFEVLDILQALVRLARTQAHQKVEEHAANRRAFCMRMRESAERQ